MPHRMWDHNCGCEPRAITGVQHCKICGLQGEFAGWHRSVVEHMGNHERITGAPLYVRLDKLGIPKLKHRCSNCEGSGLIDINHGEDYRYCDMCRGVGSLPSFAPDVMLHYRLRLHDLLRLQRANKAAPGASESPGTNSWRVPAAMPPAKARWVKHELFEYWDARTDAVCRLADEFASLDANGQREAAEAMRWGITAHVSVLSDEKTNGAALVMAHQLYTAARSAHSWEPAWANYLVASVRVMLDQAAKRGFSLQYTVIEPKLAIPVNAQHYRNVTEQWFVAAGFQPNFPVSALLSEASGDHPSKSECMRANRIQLAEAIRVQQGTRQHFIYADIEPVGPAWDLVWRARAQPGVVAAFRGTKFSVPGAVAVIPSVDPADDTVIYREPRPLLGI